MANADEKEYEIEVTLTLRVKAGGMHAAKRVAKEIVPQYGSGATLEGFGEYGPTGIRVTAGRQIC